MIDLGTLPLALLAAAMAASTAWLLRWASEARGPIAAGTIVFLLVMMAAMLLGALVYLLSPGRLGLVEGLWISAAVMSASVFPLFLLILRAARAASGPAGGPPGSPPLERPPPIVVASVIGLVLVNELLMGWTFSLAAGTPIGTGGAIAILVGSVDSPWFLFTMAAEMALTAVLIRRRIPRAVLGLFGMQAFLMFLSPVALANPLWQQTAIDLGSAGMIALIIGLLDHIYRHRQLTPSFSRYLVRLLAIYGAMMGGLLLWRSTGNAGLFGASIVVEMLLFLEAAVRPERFESGDPQPWQLDPAFAAQLLGGVFVTEVFMGGLLDLNFGGTAFLGSVPWAPLSGGLGNVVVAGLADGFWYLAAIDGSAWFLLMMGLEMGALVVLKIRESRQFEQKLRLGLMIGAYGAFTVFFPGAWGALPVHVPPIASVPWIGWTMGIGTSGALAPGVFGALLLTYAAIGALSVLFGRRVLCSVLCNAPTMYQGTLIDSMKSFNRSSPIGRKYLGSRFSSAYRVTSIAVLGSLLAASVASYLDATGVWHVSVAGADPAYFLYSFYFGVLWFVMFVTIPYTGTYNCVTMGWCHWGTFSQAFSRLGFFRLKVHSPKLCRECTTLDCAKACPVGLVDMPGHFRTTGSFRSSKCCGVGECAGACPYGNLYLSDVRHWIRAALGRERPVLPELLLPMARTASTGSAAGGPATLATPRSREA